MRSVRSLLPLGSLVIVATLVTGCSSPPVATQTAVEGLPGQIKATRSNIENSKNTFTAKLGEGKYAFIKAYTPEQQHATNFDQANAKLDQADKVLEGKVKPIVKNYEDNRQAELEAAITEVGTLTSDAQKLADGSLTWLDRVAGVKADPKGTVKKTADLVQGIQAAYEPLNGNVEAAKKTYAKNADNIGKQFQPITTQQSDALKANGLLQAEAVKATPNYAVMASHAVTVESTMAAFQKDSGAFKGRLEELDKSQTQTLLDIKVDSTIEISRTSWDEDSDINTDTDYDYPAVPVDMDTANYFAQFGPESLLASSTKGFFGDSFSTADGVDRGQWDKLGIDPNKDWPSDWHDHAEFFVGELEDTYCHKLKVLTNGKPDASGRPADADNGCSKYNSTTELADGIYWIDAEELDADAIGMDVYSKALGDFNDQATEEATPPGMAYVGDQQFGSWQQDQNNSGNSFWVFYGQYRFFSDLVGGPNPYYGRGEYDSWNRDYRYQKKPFYGNYNGQPKYGMKSPLTASRSVISGSNFVRSGLRDTSVRGAGPAARGGGPGGGGK